MAVNIDEGEPGTFKDRWYLERDPHRQDLALGREDAGTPRGTVFIPFAYYEAAANILTNPKLDPFGKIPEFKYCAVKVSRGGSLPGDPGYGKGRSQAELGA
jgi:formate dehydrogenase major subunit